MTIHVYQTRARIQGGLIAARYARRALDMMHDLAVRGATGGPYSTGRLAASIYKDGPKITGFSVRASIGSNLPYADIVEGGARVHAIFPKASPGVWRFGDRHRPQLKFIWRGRTVYTPHVPMSPATLGRSHPGMAGKHFILKAVVRTGIRYRMRVQVYRE